MELITNILAWLFAFVAGILGNIIAADICLSADRTCKKIIHRAARRLAPFDQEPVELEWLDHLCDSDTIYEKYRHAIGCYARAIAPG